MRDHRTRARALQARLRLVSRAVPGVPRVLLATRGRVTIAGRVVRPHGVHLSLTVSFDGRHVTSEHTHHAITAGTRTLRVAHRSSVWTERTIAERLVARRIETTNGVTTRVERHVVPQRRETPVPGVERVLQRPATALGSAPELGPAAAPASFARVERDVHQPAGPTPADLATITDHVLTAIDRRLVAHNERLGRG